MLHQGTIDRLWKGQGTIDRLWKGQDTFDSLWKQKATIDRLWKGDKCCNKILLAGYEKEINAATIYYWQVMEGRLMLQQDTIGRL